MHPLLRKSSRFVLLGLCLLTASAVLAAKWPRPTGYVGDYAGVFSGAQKAKLEGVLGRLSRGTGAQIAVVTVPSVEGGDVKGAAVDLFQSWGIGQKGKDNGVLFLCSVDDRRVEVEVGYGLEGILPDAKVGRILDQFVIPLFRQGDLAGGLTQGAAFTATLIAKDAGVNLGTVPIARGRGQPVPRKRTVLGTLFQIIFLVFMVIMFIRHPFLFLMLLSMGGRGGGFGGGGFGGGFGGFGGGMSGGGGAGRGW